MRAAAVVLALAGIALLSWWLRDDPTPRAGRAREAETEPLARERREAMPAADTPEARTTRVEVWIRRPDGAGVKGVTVRLIADREVARAVTGEDGVARFPEAPATLLQVWALERRLGSVSAVEGERRLEYTVAELLDLVVRVTCEGVARLPDGVRVVGPALVEPVYDAEHAEVRGRFAPPPDQRSIFVTVTAPGYARTEVLTTLPRRGMQVRAEAELVPVWRVRIAVIGPRWAAQALELDRQHVEARRKVGNTWVDVEEGRTFWLPAAAGRGFLLNTQEILYDLKPARYRLRVKNTPFVMREFEVKRDEMALRVDLTNAGLQEIVLRAPPEVALESARLVSGSHLIGPHSVAAGEARFSVILPGDREVVLEARHPFVELEPLRLVAAGDEIVVDLRLRPLVRLRLPEGATGAVLLRRLRDGKLVGIARAEPFGQEYAFAVKPARYRLRVAFKDRPPIERDIVVPEGGLDLGLIAPR